jgi:hypothetical protein
MSTKTETETKKSGEQKTTFEPSSLKGFKQLQNPLVQGILQYLEDTARQTQEQLRIGQGERAIGTAFGTQFGNIASNALALGMPSAVGPGFFQSQLARMGRARAGASAQNVIQNKFFTDRSRQRMIGLGMQFRPLQTGSSFQTEGTSTSKTSGLGTWLPQLAGAAIGGAGAFATGGASLAGGAAGLAGGTGVGSSAWGLGQSPFQAQLPAQTPYPGFGG